MTENEITETPEHLLQKDVSLLTKEEANNVLRGLLAYEIRANPESEHSNLHSYFDQLQRKRVNLVKHFKSLGGIVAPIICCNELPKWKASERPPIATLVKTKGHDLYAA